jgi:toxin-antitoxin system PIN domain toxin
LTEAAVRAARDQRTALLDVNVLIALVDPRHVHHELCHGWFADRGARPWATCAITQNGVLRILGHPRYPNSPGSPAVVTQVLRQLVAHPQHQFWPAAPSLLSELAVDTAALLDPGQITDAYLLGLAVHHDGVLATLDRRLQAQSVTHGSKALELILSSN